MNIKENRMKLTKKQQEIYSRQIMMQEIGEEGQKKLAAASVLVVGCGGLGAPVIYYLTAMGIGHLGLCDKDTVSLSNLNRQVLFTMDDIGSSKAIKAKERAIALNPMLTVTVYDMLMDEKLAGEIIPEYDIVVDCLDNFATRFILNDACIKANKPLVHAGVGEFYGQLMTIVPGKGSCLRCLFPNGIKDKKNARPPAVIGPTPGVVGTMQAVEVAKYILGLQVCNDGLMTYNGLDLSIEKVKISASPSCMCRGY
ncbi:MAG: HesA/MoeB/ThiF family protein [Oscillospiraceae bacterium]|nr:HesA/MoeB/ThiF family protein [Oscillospiraceae bacterium]